MLKRKIIDSLIKWKNESKKKCLIIQGARQVGKTYSIRLFGNEYYDELIEINFKENPDDIRIFSGDLNVRTLIASLKFRFPDMKFDPGKTLIFLDEIQECPEAITSLKFWTEDGRFDVIASGSMLGIDYKRASSYPVGYVDHVKMYGLDFEEFLWSQNISEDMIKSIHDCFISKKPVPDYIHEKMNFLFRQYITTGGMPEVVQKFVDTNDYRAVDKVQRDLLLGYQYDIAHYATAEEKIKAEKCFYSLTNQLLDKENHKFQYKEIEKGARAQKYYSSIEWLIKADIVSISRMVGYVEYDLSDHARNDFFRAYATDLSLLIPMKDFSLKQHIVENTLTGYTRGGIYESAIADILIKKGYSLYFYKKENSTSEIEFLIQKEGRIVPIEVKSSNSKSNSLNHLMNNHSDISTAYKITEGNVGKNKNGIVTIPHYMAMFL